MAPKRMSGIIDVSGAVWTLGWTLIWNPVTTIVTALALCMGFSALACGLCCWWWQRGGKGEAKRLQAAVQAAVQEAAIQATMQAAQAAMARPPRRTRANNQW